MNDSALSFAGRIAACAMALVCVVVATPSHAIEFLPNGDMPYDLADWTLSGPGSWSHAPGQGIFGVMGAAEVTSSGSGDLSMTYCSDVSDRQPGGSISASGYQRPVNHTSPVSVSRRSLFRCQLHG